MKKIVSVIKKITDIFYVAIMYLIVVAATGTMISEALIAGVLFMPLLFWGFRFCIRNQGFFTERNLRNIYIMISIISLTATFIMALWLRVERSWDWGQLLYTATEYVLNGTIDNVEYYVRCPNNKGMLWFLIRLFRFVKIVYPEAGYMVFKAVSIVVSCMFVQLSVAFLHQSALLLWNRKKAYVVGIMGKLCLPLYLYATFLYTDTVGIFLLSVLLYGCLRFKKEAVFNKKIIQGILIGVMAVLAYETKVLIFILFIAMVIDGLYLAVQDKKHIKYLMIMLLFALVSAGAVHSYFNRYSDKELDYRYRFPMTHWVMMGLGWGGYSQNDVDFTRSFVTYDEKKEANIQEIKKRMGGYGFCGMIKHIFNKKVVRTYGNSCLGGDDYVGRKPVKKSIFQRIFTQGGDMHWLCLVYTWIYHTSVLVGMLLSGVFALGDGKNVTGKMQDFLRMAFTGLFLFLCVWECNSRYLFTFIPLMVMVAMDGWFRLIKTIKNINCIKSRRSVLLQKD